MASDYSNATLGELGEAIQGGSYNCGIWTGYCQAAVKLRKKSGECFAAGKDADARLYRTMAEELEQCAKDQRAHYETYSKGQEESAFTELVKREPQAT